MANLNIIKVETVGTVYQGTNWIEEDITLSEMADLESDSLIEGMRRRLQTSVDVSTGMWISFREEAPKELEAEYKKLVERLVKQKKQEIDDSNESFIY